VLTATMVAFLAIFPGLFAVVARFCSGRARGAMAVIVLPVVWVLSEWCRGTVLSGFSFLQLGYSQIDSPLSTLAPLLGVYGASLAVAFSAAMLVWGFNGPAVRMLKAVVIVLGLWSILEAGQSLRWTEPDGSHLDVAVVQGNIAQSLKWRPEYRQRTFDIYRDYTRRHWDADLVVWPETALPGLYDSFSGELDLLEKQAIANTTALLVGVPSAENSIGQRRMFFNSVVSVGAQRAFYHKRHLVPFGEFVPLQALFQPLINFFNWRVSSFTHGGPEQVTMTVAGQVVGVSICFEIAFGQETIAALPDAGLLVNVSNDAWFGESIGPHQHLQIARWRARETGRYLVRATNTGVSAFIGPAGEIMAQLPQFEETSLVRRVDIMRGSTAYVRTRDGPLLVFLLLVAICGALSQRRR
jgi:apolipoprotein N-acyltransferase